jgi:penicillin-binding protein 2
MFRRRVWLLGVLMCAGAALPLARTIDLTTRRGEQLREAAEARLVERRLVGTTRGMILDRKGRVLAHDKPSFDVEVDYPLISGQWAFAQAAREARRVHKERWAQLSPVQRETLVQKLLPAHQARLAQAWLELARLTGVAPAELERRRAEIVERVGAQAAFIWDAKRRELSGALARGRELTEGVEGEEPSVALAEVARPIREQVSAHAVVEGLDEAAAFAFPASALPGQGAPAGAGGEGGGGGGGGGLLAGMRLVDGRRREYPMDEVEVDVPRAHFPAPLRSEEPITVRVAGVATPLVGWMRGRLYKEDLERRPLRRAGGPGQADTIDLGGYVPGDSAGGAGVELSAEDRLRGARGSVLTQLDTGEVTRTAPSAGQSVKLTLDARLQARVLALLDPRAGLTTVQPWQNNKALEPGTRLHAAAAVLDIETGDVLALVSTPTFGLQQLRDDPESVLKNEVERPLLSRAMGRAYAPGSIVKPLVLCEAAARAGWRADRTVACGGHFAPDRPDALRCWIYKQSGQTHTGQFGRELRADEAVMVSCNIYFFTVGQALGPEGLMRLFGGLGVGTQPGTVHSELGVGYQFDGAVGRLGRQEGRAPITPAEAVLMGIGQGPIAWTPLHAADAYATLARGGVRIVPRMRGDVEAKRIDLGWPAEATEVALRGLWMSVNDERGTGHHLSLATWDGIPLREVTFNVPGVRVWGKSGTADSGVKSEDNPDASLDHSWFVVLVGDESGGKPRYAVSLLVEYGGSGGRVAGPLCNQILWALRLEGYL